MGKRSSITLAIVDWLQGVSGKWSSDILVCMFMIAEKEEGS